MEAVARNDDNVVYCPVAAAAAAADHCTEWAPASTCVIALW